MALPSLPLDVALLRQGSYGDCAIELRRGLAGKPGLHKRNIADLQLAKPGQWALGFLWDAAFVGKYHRSAHLLQFLRLRAPVYVDPAQRVVELPDYYRQHWTAPFDGDFAKDQGVLRAISPSNAAGALSGGKLMKEIPYPPEPNTNVRGRYFELSGDEYIQVELQSRGAVVLWSSTTPVDEFVAKATQYLQRPVPATGSTIKFLGQSPIVSSLDEVEELALKSPDQVERLLLRYRGCTVSWRSPRRKMEWSTEAFAQTGLACRSMPVALLAHMMTETATDRVSEVARTDLSKIVHELGTIAV